MELTRRQALAAAATAPLAVTLGAGAASAGGHIAPGAVSQDFALGDFRVTTLLAANRVVEDPHGIFGLNVDETTFADVSASNFIPTDKARFYFTPTVVNTGSEVVLFDTGTDPGGLVTALAAAGYQPADINHVVITHMHGDHIGGLADDAGAVTFEGASYHTGRVEFDHWSAAGNDGFEAKVRPLAERFAFLEDGNEVRPGISAVAAFGHTPGHMAYRLESGGQSLIIMADTANHYVWSLGYPDWEVRFDMDKAQAASTRRSLLGMVASDRLPLIGYHMPFPGLGYVEARDDGGFRYVPHSYQLI